MNHSAVADRRRPLPVLVGAVILVMILRLFMAAAGYSSSAATFRKSENHMGTVVSITVVDENRGKAERAMAAAFREVARIDGLLSNYRDDSEVSRLNRDKVLKDPSADLVANIRRSLYYGRLSGGAFDITVQPVLDLYEHTFRELNRPPTTEEVRSALRSVDYRRVVPGDTVLSIGADQKITLGGIAKGYAVDRALEVLREKGIRQALVDAGGDLGTMGRYGGRDWIVALRNPRDRDDFITRLKVSGQAVVTSGDYERYYDEEKNYHHIVDPRSGYSATELISVTVVAGTAFDADAVSTSVFVLGREEGLRLIESLEGVEGLLITRGRRIIRSSGWKAFELGERSTAHRSSSRFTHNTQAYGTMIATAH